MRDTSPELFSWHDGSNPRHIDISLRSVSITYQNRLEGCSTHHNPWHSPWQHLLTIMFNNQYIYIVYYYYIILLHTLSLPTATRYRNHQPSLPLFRASRYCVLSTLTQTTLCFLFPVWTIHSLQCIIINMVTLSYYDIVPPHAYDDTPSHEYSLGPSSLQYTRSHTDLHHVIP